MSLASPIEWLLIVIMTLALPLPIVTMTPASPLNGCLLLPCHRLHHGMAALFYPVFAEYFGSCSKFTLRLLHVPLLKN